MIFLDNCGMSQREIHLRKKELSKALI